VTSALDGGEWSVLCSGPFNSRAYGTCDRMPDEPHSWSTCDSKEILNPVCPTWLNHPSSRWGRRWINLGLCWKPRTKSQTWHFSNILFIAYFSHLKTHTKIFTFVCACNLFSKLFSPEEWSYDICYWLSHWSSTISDNANLIFMI